MVRCARTGSATHQSGPRVQSVVAMVDTRCRAQHVAPSHEQQSDGIELTRTPPRSRQFPTRPIPRIVRRVAWPRSRRLQSRSAQLVIACNSTTAARNADDPAPICASLACAGFASVRWHSRGCFRVSRRQVGKRGRASSIWLGAGLGSICPFGGCAGSRPTIGC